MPKAKTPPIIDLTEIVQEKDTGPVRRQGEDELTDQVSDLMRDDPADDIELDDLLAQLNDGVDEPAPSAPAVNPNESLDMPGMDDMDAVMDQFETPAASAGEPADPELDDLLAGLDKDAPEPAANVQGVTVTDAELDDLLDDLPAPDAPAGTEQPGAEDQDELDALLSELDPPEITPAKRAPEARAGGLPLSGDDLDALLGGGARTEAAAGSAVSGKPASGKGPVKDAELDDLLADLGGEELPAKEVVKDAELDDLLAELDAEPKPRPQPKAPAKTPKIDHPVVDEELEGLLDELDATVEAVGEEVARQAAGQPDPENPEPSETLDTTDLDAFLDEPPAAAAPAPAAPVASAASEDLEQLREQMNAMAFSLQTALEQQQSLRERLDALAPAAPAEAPDGRLDAIEERLDTLADTDARLDALEERLNSLAGATDGRLDAIDERLKALPDTSARLDAFEERLQSLTDLDGKLGTLEARLDAVDRELYAVRERLEQFADLPDAVADLRGRLEQLEQGADVTVLAERILDAMRPDIEKAAASAAATIIREEILALFAEQEA